MSASSHNASFLEHLDELRRRLLYCVCAVAVTSIISYVASDYLLRWAVAPAKIYINSFYFSSPTEAFAMKVKLAIFCGFVLSLPAILFHLWKFLTPGLYPHESLALWILILFGTLLFGGGVVFCYTLVMPAALGFLLSMQNDILKPLLGVGPYLDFLLWMLMAFGVAFNLPIGILGLVSLKVLSPQTLFKTQRHAILFIFIFAAVLTPGPDIASQFLLAVPLLVLYEASVFIAWVLFRKSKAV